MATDRQRVDVVVIGAGLCRTGTTSFKKALEILGVGPCYHMIEVSKNNDAAKWYAYAKRPTKELLDNLLGGNGYRSSCDMPTSPFWKEQLELYPNAKVILTSRDAEKWYHSCEDTVFRMNPHHPVTPFGIKLCYWLGIISRPFGDMLDEIMYKRVFKENWDKASVIACYDEHNRDVIASCPKDKLLVFEVSQGWGPLCKFLDLPVPKEPFPHVNDTKSFQAMVSRRQWQGYMTLGGIVVGAAAVVWAGSMLLRQKK